MPFKSTVKIQKSDMRDTKKVSKVRPKNPKKVSKVKISSNVDSSKKKIRNTKSLEKSKFPDTGKFESSNFGEVSLQPASVPFQEKVDLIQQVSNNVPDIQSVFDVSIGFGVANPGETGVAAVERIKAERLAKRKKSRKK